MCIRDSYLVVPTVEALAHLMESSGAAAVLIPSNQHGKEMAARLAVRTSSGLITDAIDVRAGGDGVETTQSVFAGSYSVDATVTKGTPIITVKPNSCAPQEASGAGTVQQVDLAFSEAAKAARIVERKEKQKSGRPELTEAAIVVSGGRGTGGDFAKVESLSLIHI